MSSLSRAFFGLRQWMPFLTLTTCETRQSETRRHQLLGLLGRDVALLGEKLDRLRLGLGPGLVEIRVETHRDPGFRRLDAREVERLALDDFHREVHFPVGRLDRGGFTSPLPCPACELPVHSSAPAT